MISTSAVLTQVDAGNLDLLHQTDHYVICQPVLKEYLPSEYLVKSSGDPIDPGDERLPYMDLTEQLYRELRHRFDWTNNLHAIEVEISVQ